MASVAYPATTDAEAGEDEDEKKRKRDKYNLKQYRGLADSIVDIKDKVDKERRHAIETEKNLRRTMYQQGFEAREVQKELSVQLRVAGRSYEQLLIAMREITEQLREEEERRHAEVAPLKAEIKQLQAKLSVIEKPWQDEVLKRDLRITKLQEMIPPLEQKIRDERMKLPPVIEKFKREIKVREEATECVLKEMEYWKTAVEQKVAEGAAALAIEQERAAKEIAPVKAELEQIKEVLSTVTDPYVKEIRLLKKQIEVLEHELSQVDYTPYEKQLGIKDLAYKKLVRDFEVKEAYNKDNHDKMRENFEHVLVRMEKKVLDLQRAQEQLVAPYEEALVQKDDTIRRLEDRWNAFKEEEGKHRKKQKDVEDELRRELKAAKEAVEAGHRELTRAKKQLNEAVEEFEGDGGPKKRLLLMEMKLEAVTQKCEALVRQRDQELEEKTDIIKNLQLAGRTKLDELQELDRIWNQRIKKKEAGYQLVVAELAHAEGQIVEERELTAKKVREVRLREQDIIRLKEEHTEELRMRLLDRQALEKQIRALTIRLADTESSLEQEVRNLEDEVEFHRKRTEQDLADYRVEVERRDRAIIIAEKECAQVRSEYTMARIAWDDKERELEILVRTRDRHIIALKNEIEFISDSWEIKYNNLVAVFEKLQKKYDAACGPNGVAEYQRRILDLKEEVYTLNNTIEDYKEQLKKQKRRIRDLEIEIDCTLKETADVLAEKERGIANMVGDYSKLQNRFKALEKLMDQMIHEKETELINVVESFQARIDQLEQLCESMRFTDRQELVDRIETWKKAYQRVCLARDNLEEELREQCVIKDAQVLNMAVENNTIRDDAQKEFIAIECRIDKINEDWSKKQTGWKLKEIDLEKKISEMDLEIMRLQMLAKKAELTHDTKADDEEKLELKRLLAEKDLNIAEMARGVALLVEENREKTEQVETKAVDTDAIHASYVPLLAEKDRMIKVMEKEYEELKEVLEIEMFRAQEACRAIEERVKKFPNPFEFEIKEMRGKFAQMQAGMLKMSLENIKLREDFVKIKEDKEEEINILEKQLHTAAQIIKDIAAIGVLQNWDREKVMALELAFGVDIDGDGQIGA